LATGLAVLGSWLIPAPTGLPLGLAGISGAVIAIPAAVSLALLGLALLYNWPFKVALQRNLLGLDNYITSRFSRMNQNFQVAKRFALNVERNKRMTQAEELKYEAGVWTVAYNWFAMRLYLCERVVRNQMYQINRNATLYAVFGMVVTGLIGAGILGGLHVLAPGMLTPLTAALAAGATLLFVFIAYLGILGGMPSEARALLHRNEWFRFGGAELDRTIKDHVGEDKLQIVTFRDRNRME
jgi:hypothetical protein